MRILKRFFNNLVSKYRNKILTVKIKMTNLKCKTELLIEKISWSDKTEDTEAKKTKVSVNTNSLLLNILLSLQIKKNIIDKITTDKSAANLLKIIDTGNNSIK